MRNDLEFPEITENEDIGSKYIEMVMEINQHLINALPVFSISFSSLNI